MKKNYTSNEILEMAVKKAAASYYADLDRNGVVDVADARIALRREKGLDSDDALHGSPSSSGTAQNAQPSGTGAFGGYYDGDNTVMKKELLDSVIADTGKSYSIATDKLYNEYRREYEKSAFRAAKNAYGTAASYTGGYGSSYAASAAADAYGRYISALAEKMPDFAESAAAVKKSGIQSKLDILSEIRKDEEESYSRYSDAVKNAWTSAENGDYSYLEALGMDTSAMREEKAMAQAVSAAKYGDYSGLRYMGVDTSSVEYAESLDNAVKIAGQGDYSYLKALGVDVSKLQSDDKLEKAVTLAKYGDYSGLKALGVDTSTVEYARLLDNAVKIAGTGDYSYLEALGVDVSKLQSDDKLEKALALAKYGDYSLLGDFSSNITLMKEKINFTVQRGASAAYAAGGYGGLLSYLNKQIDYGQITEKGKEQIIKALTQG